MGFMNRIRMGSTSSTSSARWRIALIAATVVCGFPACGGSSSETADNYGCLVTSTTPLAWTATSVWGTPEQVFARFAGTCQAPFDWNSSWSGYSLSVAPPSGADTLTATVDIDTTSARWKAQRALPSGPLEMRPACDGLLEVDASVSLVLSSGAVVAEKKVTLSARSAQAPTLITLSLSEAQFGNWISIAKKKVASAETLWMDIQVYPVGASCAGSVRLVIEQPPGDAQSGISGRLASWSDSGCAEEKTAVPLDTPYQGIDFHDAVASAFSEATIPGRWSLGGEATSLILNATPNGVGCAEHFFGGGEVTIPVVIAASTADKRIQGLTGTGTIGATFGDARVSVLRLDLYLQQPCSSNTLPAAYPPADCATMERIGFDLHFNRYPPQGSPNSGYLSVYQYQRGVDAGGWVDLVDELVLGP